MIEDSARCSKAIRRWPGTPQAGRSFESNQHFEFRRTGG